MKKGLIILLIGLFIPFSTYADIAFDAFSQNKTTGTSLTFAHTVTGSNRLIVVGLSNQSDASGTDVTSVTYNGDALTKISHYTNPQNDTVYLYYLIAPDSGSNNVVVTRADATGTLQARVWSITGAQQNAQPSAYITANTTTGTLTTTLSNVTANNWTVLMAYNQEGGTITGTTNARMLGTTDLYSRLFDNSSTAPATTTGAYSMVLTRPSGSSVWQSVMASFAPYVETPTATSTDEEVDQRIQVETYATILFVTSVSLFMYVLIFSWKKLVSRRGRL